VPLLAVQLTGIPDRLEWLAAPEALLHGRTF
jgi:hypothetical protein